VGGDLHELGVGKGRKKKEGKVVVMLNAAGVR
jgi:hypothetical protein